LGNKICRAPGGFTQRHAEPEKIFGVHIVEALSFVHLPTNFERDSIKATALSYSENPR
jgi:hypothetical protein